MKYASFTEVKNWRARAHLTRTATHTRKIRQQNHLLHSGLKSVLIAALKNRMKCLIVALVLAANHAMAKEDLDSGDSEVHYQFKRHYGYLEPHHYHHYDYGHHGHHHHVTYHIPEGYGHEVKQGYHYNDGFHHHGHEVVEHHGYGHPPYTGYVPAHGPGGYYDHGYGFAHGHDAIGPFDHHTGAFGPFGFYANFYHDRK